MPKGDVRLRADNGDSNQVAARVKQRRKALKVTQEGLCARLAYVTEGRWVADRQEIVRIESGGRIVSDVELIALAKALECDPCWLLLGDRDDQADQKGERAGTTPSPTTTTNGSAISLG
jgi:transcriptional regulator with XRE-family HTH domain